MKIHLISDLHLEFSQYKPHPDSEDADVIVAAGDVWSRDNGINMLREMFPKKPIVTVSGNHEHYKTDIHRNIKRMRVAAAETGIHFLENDEVIINLNGESVRFLGCTLWTDFQLFGLENRPECMLEAQQSINDFKYIRNGEWNFSPADSISIHNKSVAWLKAKLDEKFEGSTVVVTHHGPSYESVVDRYKADLLSACFSSRLDDLLDGNKVRLWCHGHIHSSVDYTVNGTRVVANPRGYTRYEGGEENEEFNTALLIEV